MTLGSNFVPLSIRDLLKWSGNSLAPFPQLPMVNVPETWDIQARVNSVLRTFCPNLNCVESHCSVHGKTLAGMYNFQMSHRIIVAEQPDMKAPVPKILNSSLRLAVGDPCDRDCFRHEDDNFAVISHEVVFLLLLNFPSG
jgi:hypothetical protein